MQIAAVILAAGASTRFGSPKQLARIGRHTMLEMVADVARAAGLSPLIAVVPRGMAVPPGVVPEINDAPEHGLSRSLRLGLAAVPSDTDAALILLGDQPTVAQDTIRAVIAGARADRPIVAALASGRLAPPVLLRRAAFAITDGATGDEGLRSVLALHPELVTEVEVVEHARDVDAPEDLAAIIEACAGCGGLFEPMPNGTTHEYIGSSAACWTAFGELLAREFQDPAYGSIHRHTVDVYTVQHPGTDDRRQRQSVAVHLIGLCHWLEYAMAMPQLNPITQRLASEGRDWPWLDAPDDYALTVLDVLAATDGAEHARFVRAWGESTWAAWEPHHELIRRWARAALH